MQPQMQAVVPFTPMIKKLVIINVVVWVVGVLILQNFILPPMTIVDWLALRPSSTFVDFWLWQPLTYMFLHDTDVFHILFNMLILWWLGAELELRWGGREFLKYYLVCGVGAAIFYSIGVNIYYVITLNKTPMDAYVLGASGAVFGVMMAYGILFGERVIYFMMLFPMKAKYFVMILGLVEIFTMMSKGLNNKVSNLCHLGGLAVGYMYLKLKGRRGGRFGGPGRKVKRKLKLVVDNEERDKPRYWH